MDITVKTKGAENVKSVIANYDYSFSYFFNILIAFIISQQSFQWGRLHFATFMCNINYKFIYYANLPFSYYSQFTVIIFFDNCVAGYIALLCILIAQIYSSSMSAC